MQFKIALSPICIDVEQVPTAGYRAVFTTEINGLTFTGENMSETLGLGHYGTVTVQWKDSMGNPAKVDGPTRWASTDDKVLTCTVTTGDPLIANCTAVAIGSAQIHATADADMGAGVKTITSTIDVTVIAGEAVGGSMAFKDVGTSPPPATTTGTKPATPPTPTPTPTMQPKK